MESRFGHDFSTVRVHAGDQAASSARAVEAVAYTVNRHIVFGEGFHPSGSPLAVQVLAHELSHVVQQANVPPQPVERIAPEADDREREADAVGRLVLTEPSAQSLGRSLGRDLSGTLRRQTFRTPGVAVRSPVFEEAAMQLTEFQPGRALTRDERSLAQSVFGKSIDYDRVRLLPTQLLKYRTVGNAIRIPVDFTIGDELAAETFIHELTHVWQYQHSGTSYISISLGTQLAASIRHGSRAFAYGYEIRPGQTFFDFTPEQQAFIVENYFAMRTQQDARRSLDSFTADIPTRCSNHFDATGFRAYLTPTEREEEIRRELPAHEPLIQQLRAALPMKESSVLMLRASEVMQLPAQSLLPSAEAGLASVKPLLEVRW